MESDPIETESDPIETPDSSRSLASPAASWRPDRNAPIVHDRRHVIHGGYEPMSPLDWVDACMKRWTVLAAPSLPMLLLVGGCGRVARERAPAELPNYRVDAVVAFGQGIDDEILYALREPRRFAWSFAPAMRVPATDKSGGSAVGSADSAQRPLLVVVQGYVGERPYANVSLIEVGRASPDSPVAEDLVAHPCVGESWLAAFFVEGLGPRPVGPVVFRYTAAGSTYRLRIDPNRHTLRATPALQLRREDVDVDSSLPERLVVSIRPSNTFKPVMPLVAWRDERQWRAAGGTGRDGHHGVTMSGYRDRSPIQEWRFYMLEAPPRC